MVGAACLLLAALAYFTLYRPLARPHSNAATAGAFTVRLSAAPAAPPGSPARQVDLSLQIEGPLEDVTGVDLAMDMPSMGHEGSPVTPAVRQAPGRYTARATLTMAGLWRVTVIIHQSDGGHRRAAFDMRL